MTADEEKNGQAVDVLPEEQASTTIAATTTGEPVLAEGDEKDKMLKAVEQIEFYLADSNLPYDRFMWTLYTANPEHWIPIATLASFKRMKEFNALGIEWMANAVSLSECLEVDETKTKVRRLTEVQEPKGQFERSIYAKGFGKEEADTQQKLEEYFKQYGKTNAVRMRRTDTKEFKGSIFVEFTEMKTVEDFLKADPKPSWDGEDLLIMTKEDYCDMKMKEKGIENKGRSKELTGSRRGFNAFREMEKAKAGKGKGAAATETAKPEIWLEFMGSKIRVHEDDGGTVKDEDVPHVKGATLKFEGFEGELQYNDIKTPLRERFSRAPFIKYTKGDNHGLLSFDKTLTEEDIEFVKETLGTLDSKELEWSIADTEVEREFQLERAKTAARQALSYSQNGKGFTRGGRGGRGGKGGRGGRGGYSKYKIPENGDRVVGEKRKRAAEPDGGPDTGIRGAKAPPQIQVTKKMKTDS